MSRGLLSRVFRFGAVGIASTLIHVTVALLLSGILSVGNLEANFFGFCTAWSVSYLGNYYWTFLASSRHRVSMPRFALTSLTCLITSLLIVQWTTRYLGWPFFVSQLIIVAAIPLLSFALSALWVFKPAHEGPAR
jgi:putative flippase GtrA